MSDQPFIIAQLREILRQGGALIESLSDQAYTAAPENLSGVGAHFRHVLDFTDRFLDDFDSGRVDYDIRARDLSSEIDRSVALKRLKRTSSRFQSLEGQVVLEQELHVRADAPAEDGDLARAIGDHGWNISSVRRELTFLLSHSVHHYALISMLLRMQGLDPGREFGVAPSTLAFWKETESCAPLVG